MKPARMRKHTEWHDRQLGEVKIPVGEAVQLLELKEVRDASLRGVLLATLKRKADAGQTWCIVRIRDWDAAVVPQESVIADETARRAEGLIPGRSHGEVLPTLSTPSDQRTKSTSGRRARVPAEAAGRS